jgi:hypothetical protein
MTLSVDVKTHAITYFGKGHDFVTSKESEIIMRLMATGDAKGCKLKNGNWITVSSISRITPIDQFYEENPDLRPKHSNYTYSGPTQIPQHRGPSPNAAKLMKRGLVEQLKNDGRNESDAGAILKSYNK